MVGLGLFAGGFWILGVGFVHSNVLVGLLGGLMLLAGLTVMALARRR